jgi:hypothetical protein
MMNIYSELTNRFNAGCLRAILSSGQAVVLHRLAIMSKDGDWIVREEDNALEYIIGALEQFGAHYRFGAPLDKKWLSGGWSSHFEFKHEELRVRTDFVSRPPRISEERLKEIWIEQENRSLPFLDCVDLAKLKETNREKDYAIIGELSRKMEKLEDKVRFSRSARDIFGFFQENPTIVSEIMLKRGIQLNSLISIETLETALDAERRRLMHTNEHRLERYSLAAEKWAAIWKDVEKETNGLSLMQAHRVIGKMAEDILPFSLPAVDIHE